MSEFILKMRRIGASEGSREIASGLALAMTFFWRFFKRGWFKEATPVFILLVFVVLFFSDVLFENKIFIHRDITRFFYPLREFSAAQFKAGHVPLWNPFIHCGSPHLAELQTCVFYPLSVVYLLFPHPKAFNYFIILHVFFAGLFMYFLMREWRYSRPASFFSASVFMSGGYMISVINLLASLASVTWLPLAILFYGRAMEKDWVKNSIFTGIFLTFMLLGGEPAILLGTVFILLLLSADGTYGSPAPIGEPGFHRFFHKRMGIDGGRIAPLMAALVVMLGLSCFQILPFLEFLRHTSRHAMGFDEAAMWSLPPYALLDLIVPYLSETDYLYKDYWTRQSWLLVYYMGLSSVIFAWISLKFDAAKRRRLVFYILMLGLVLSLGRYTPFYYLLYRAVPAFSLSRYPIKFFFMVSFSIAVLGGMGLQYYMDNVKTNKDLRRFLRSALTLAFIGALIYLALSLNFFQAFSFLYNKAAAIFADKKGQLNQLLFAAMSNFNRLIAFFMVIAVAMFFGVHKKIRLNMVIPALIFISLLDIYTGNRKLYLNMDIGQYLEPGETVGFLKKDRSLFRIFDSPVTLSQNMFVPEKDYFEGVEALKDRMVSNRGVGFGIYDAYGYGSLYNKRHEEIIKLITRSRLPDDTNLLSLLNVKYVISPKEFRADGYEAVKKGGKANIYENESVLPRAFLAGRAVVIKDEAGILERMGRKEFDPAKEIILEQDFSFANHEQRTTNNETLDILRYSPNEVVIETQANAPRFLLLSDSYYPGWRAYVDGKKAKIHRADYILRAVQVGPGRHIIRFTYDPFSFKIGVMITLAMIIMIAIFFERRHRRRCSREE